MRVLEGRVKMVALEINVPEGVQALTRVLCGRFDDLFPTCVCLFCSGDQFAHNNYTFVGEWGVGVGGQGAALLNVIVDERSMRCSM